MAIDIFKGINFATIASDPGFNEEKVRSFIINPLLNYLGYTIDHIHPGKTLQCKQGSKNVPVYADYVLSVGGYNAFVLEAKAPTVNITDDVIDQAFYYAIHRDVKSNYFAVCNGIEFALFNNNKYRTRIFDFRFENWEKELPKLRKRLSLERFQPGVQPHKSKKRKRKTFDYANCPLLEEVPVRKRAKRRHFGVHGYFTKQSWDIVQTYIKNFTQKDDLVLDPFGGSGVTAVEALMSNRKAIHIDINPLANFLVESLLTPVNAIELDSTFQHIKTEYQKHEPKTESEIQKALRTYPRPNPIPLDKHADVRTADKLFSPKQTAQLGLLKSLILKIADENIRKSFMLMFSGLVSRVNLTYHTGKAAENAKGKSVAGANAAAFQYYRYRIAPDPTEIDTMSFFERRYNAVRAAKTEMEFNKDTVNKARIVKGTATDLSFIKDESVDYIYTDPPYGKKIPYLDLSAMWNAWLDLDVTEEDYALEAIEGGERKKTKQEYKDLIAQSIAEMYRVLKYDRWLTFVFYHKDLEFWHMIVDTAENCGFEYVGAVPQKNGQTSFKKRQHPLKVLSGQLMINFRKIKDPKVIMKANATMDVEHLMLETVATTIMENYGATLEQINDALIIRGLELGLLELWKEKYPDLTLILEKKFKSEKDKYYITLKKNERLPYDVDLYTQIDYWLTMFIREKEALGESARSDDVNRHILPRLNLNTSGFAEITFNEVIEDRCVPCGEDCLELKPKTVTLFG